MKVLLEGQLLEKFVQTNDKKEEVFKLRIYQKGEKLNTDVAVSKATFDKVAEGGIAKLLVSVNAYNFNGNVGLSAKEIF